MNIEDLLKSMKLIAVEAAELNQMAVDSVWNNNMDMLLESAQKLSVLTDGVRANACQVRKLGADAKQLAEVNQRVWAVERMEHAAWDHVRVHVDMGMIKSLV